MPPTSGAVPDPTLDAYRRRIRVEATGDRRVEGELADDMHHFRIVLHHNGAVVTDVSAESLRYPWDTCPGAVGELRSLIGAPLGPKLGGAAKHADPKANCTHMFDLAALAMTQAWRSGPAGSGATATRRQYDVEYPVLADGADSLRLRLWRDGHLLLEWELECRAMTERRILAPEPYASAPFARGFSCAARIRRGCRASAR